MDSIIDLYKEFRSSLVDICAENIISDISEYGCVKPIEYQGKLVGFLTVQGGNYIEGLYIKEEYRRKHLARDAVMNAYRELGEVPLYLHIINNNEPAKAFWNSLFVLSEVNSNPIDTYYVIEKVR